jgi:hypothetical protein
MTTPPLRLARRRAIAVLFVAQIACSVWIAPAAWGQDTAEPDHVEHPTLIIGIVPTRLLPTVLVVPNGSAFGWLNYASREARIEFDEDIGKKLTCRSPGQFRAAASELAAPRIASGGFVTLCSLAPGTYDYQVKLRDDKPSLLGKLVVEPES